MNASEPPYSKNSPDRGRLIVVSGPSGVGKSTIVDRVVDALPMEFSVSATTRTARPGEVDGRDYHFIDRDTFETMVESGELLEWAEYGGNLYGTPLAPVLDRLARGVDVLLEIEVQGARQVKAVHPDAVAVFVAPPSVDVLEQRLRGRGDTDGATMQERLGIARRELAAADEFDVVVVNDELETVIEEIVRILSVPAEKKNQ